MVETKSRRIERDERSVAVEDASYRVGYLFTVFALLLAVMYRSWFTGDPAWDLLAIVIVSGGITTAYQLRHRILSPSSARIAILTAVGAAVMAAVVLVLVNLSQ